MRETAEILDWLLDEKTSTFRVFCHDMEGNGTLEPIIKSEASGVRVYDEERRPIGGWCSTETKDRQDEVVVAKGLDFDPFTKWGYYNDNHKQGTADVLGWPVSAELLTYKGDRLRWYTKGHLFKGTGDSDRVWELAKSMEKSGAPRRLGFSIEGKVLERNGHNRITRAIVRNVAITNCPVNPECEWSILAKAFAPIDEVEQARRKWASLMIGHQNPVIDGGDVMRPESLESIRRPRKRTKTDAVNYVRMIRPQWSKAMCERFVDHVMNMQAHQEAA